MVVAGSQHYIGAVALAAEAAYRSGAGLVTVATTRRLIETSRRILCGNPLGCRCLKCGRRDCRERCRCRCFTKRPWIMMSLLGRMWLGFDTKARSLVPAPAARQSIGCRPLVLDADALNLLSQDAGLVGCACLSNTVVTPHPGELARYDEP